MRLLLALLLTLPALAGPKESEGEIEGIPLVITIIDGKTGKPIPFATVRETQERQLKMVERASGQISMSKLYPSYNDEIPLTRGMELNIEVTAAAYEPKLVTYTMRRRRNRVLVSLEPMEIEANYGSEPQLQFGRDKPLDSGRELTKEEMKELEAEMEEARKEREASPPGP
ncbi:MAG: hypothetical protein EA397_03310 [Deltaproteobacteria bacterium]|nr:MAG: hypothetical protein EA397_03310 [Deltaproteobacteria bacterium]